MSCLVYADQSKYLDRANEISKYLNIEITIEIPSHGSLLQINDKGISFIEDLTNTSNILYIDFLSGPMGWRLKRSDHETLLKKTLGKNKDILTIFDGTGGFLSDALIFLALGHKVIACEQSKIVYLLVKDAINRAKTELPYLENLTLLNKNSVDVYKDIDIDIDLIYLDPLYPEIKKNVLRSGNMNIIRTILEIENIQESPDDLFFDIKEFAYKKIVLKRPIKAEVLDKNINYQVKGKSTRFDIYI
tara:strand:+ start:1080 stop:1817 length:738 start_codon:yes stop_codon:yes gene_type:complete